MLKFNQRYITVDCETSGLNLQYSQPWQVSWVEHEGTKLISEHDLYVDIPDLYIPDRIKKMTGFNQVKYDREKRPPREVCDMLMARLLDPEYRIIGQNILGYDIYMIAVLQQMAGYTPQHSYIERIIDTLPLAKAYKHELDRPKGDLLSWQFKVMNNKELRKRVGLKQLLKDLGIDFDENQLHNSLYDVKKTKEVFDCLRKVLDL